MRVPGDVYADEVKFETSLSINQSVNRLKLKLQEKKTASFFDPHLVGSVATDRIRLSQAKAMHGNIFKPYFNGQFRATRNRGTKITGYFAMNPLAALALLICQVAFVFGFLIATLACFMPGPAHGTGAISKILIALLLLLIPVGLNELVRRRGVSEMYWIRQEIEDALH